MIPALKNAEFLRYGVMHRNTYIHSPDVLNRDFSVKNNESLYFAGQITGVEGYVESAASGLLAAVHLSDKIFGRPPRVFGNETVSGALENYISSPNKDFQPMNANFGILAPLPEKIRDKKNGIGLWPNGLWLPFAMNGGRGQNRTGKVHRGGDRG